GEAVFAAGFADLRRDRDRFPVRGEAEARGRARRRRQVEDAESPAFPAGVGALEGDDADLGGARAALPREGRFVGRDAWGGELLDSTARNRDRIFDQPWREVIGQVLEVTVGEFARFVELDFGDQRVRMGARQGGGFPAGRRGGGRLEAGFAGHEAEGRVGGRRDDEQEDADEHRAEAGREADGGPGDAHFLPAFWWSDFFGCDFFLGELCFFRVFFATHLPFFLKRPFLQWRALVFSSSRFPEALERSVPVAGFSGSGGSG